MKKIALLCMILCVGQLYSMNKNIKESVGHYTLEALPSEVKAIIISFLRAYDKLEDVIKAIKALSETNKELNVIVNKMYGNQKGFVALIKLLADKFDKIAPIKIARQFKTPAAAQFVKIQEALLRGILDEDKEMLAKAIKDGALVLQYDVQKAEEWGSSEEIKKILEEALKKQK